MYAVLTVSFSCARGMHVYVQWRILSPLDLIGAWKELIDGHDQDIHDISLPQHWYIMRCSLSGQYVDLYSFVTVTYTFVTLTYLHIPIQSKKSRHWISSHCNNIRLPVSSHCMVFIISDTVQTQQW
jgi:hypothetical protein